MRNINWIKSHVTFLSGGSKRFCKKQIYFFFLLNDWNMWLTRALKCVHTVFCCHKWGPVGGRKGAFTHQPNLRVCLETATRGFIQNVCVCESVLSWWFDTGPRRGWNAAQGALQQRPGGGWRLPEGGGGVSVSLMEAAMEKVMFTIQAPSPWAHNHFGSDS